MMGTNMANDRLPIVSAELCEGRVNISWHDGFSACYHDISLRHSPGFPGARRPAGPDGRFLRDKQSIEVVASEISDSGELLLSWSDGRHSKHDSDWLRENAYVDSKHQIRQRVTTWDAEKINQQNSFNYSDLVNNDEGLLALSEHLLEFGAALLRNVPTDMDIVAKIGKKLGHVPANLYADSAGHPSICNVRVDPRVTVATNMCHFLGPHTDTCWRQTLIGLLLMHCLKAHPEGGRSIVVDGFAVAHVLREQDEGSFNLLAQTPLMFSSKVDNGDDWRVLGRVLSVAADGLLEGIRYNGNSIGQLQLPPDLVEPVYHALERFEEILYDRNQWWQPQLQPGDLLILDNHRVLHGREAFDPSAGERHLQCCGVDRDDFHNRYRHLARKFKSPGANIRLSAGVI
jgi:gamma-butyrobetaine dioxygenase